MSFFFLVFFKTCISVFPACVFVHHMHSVPRRQNRALLQAVENHAVVAGNESRSSGQTNSAFNL